MLHPTQLYCKHLKKPRLLPCRQLTLYPRGNGTNTEFLSLYLAPADKRKAPKSQVHFQLLIHNNVDSALAAVEKVWHSTYIDDLHTSGMLLLSPHSLHLDGIASSQPCVLLQFCCHTFNEDEADWGWTKFAPLKDVYDPAKGFISSDDTLVITTDVVINLDGDEQGITRQLTYLAGDLSALLESGDMADVTFKVGSCSVMQACRRLCETGADIVQYTHCSCIKYC